MLEQNIISFELRHCLNSCLAIAKKENLALVVDAIQNVLSNLDSPMQLAIIGKISSSKSTIVNAILGNAEIVETGQMETTYNVSWLKYGPSDKDIKVVFKDGTSKLIERKNWKEWSGQAENKLKDSVKYIEVTYNHDILRQVNIIDTPGLDSTMGTDSQNTIDFLKDVRPDAVLMVFTKGLADETMKVVRDFQGKHENQLSISPLNAIGVLSKIDDFWHIDKSSKHAIDIAQSDVIDGNIYHLFSEEVNDTLYGILPLCALLGLASQTITQDDLDLLRTLSLTDETELAKMFKSVNRFTDNRDTTGISAENRIYLEKKFGRYGVFELLSVIKQGRSDILFLSQHLKEISGFNRFNTCLYSHFGERSYLIKTQNANHLISSACNKQKTITQSASGRMTIDSIQSMVLSTLMGIFEYRQLDFLSKIYEKTMDIKDEKANEEYKRVCGEYGNSVVNRMELPNNYPISNMVQESKNRALIANKKAALNKMKSPQDAELYKMIALSYEHLGERIAEMQQKKADAEEVIRITHNFFYGG